MPDGPWVARLGRDTLMGMTGWSATVTPLVRALALLALLVALASAAAHADGPRELFYVDRATPEAAVVTTGEQPVEPQGSAMLDRLAGVIARLDGRAVRRWRSVPESSRRSAEPDKPLTALATMWLEPPGRRGRPSPDEPKRVDLYRDAQGAFFGRAPDDDDRFYRLSGRKVRALIEHWPRHVPERESRRRRGREQPPSGEAIELDHPYQPGWFVFDEDLVDERIYRDQRVRIKGTERELDEQTLIVRLPRGYDGRSRPGVVVWIDPSDRGVPPESLHRALDELDLIAVGARGMGNRTPIVDRFQLVFDGIATVRHRYRIDPERIYAVGMSGGGRAASMLWGAFPDVFTGAVPIVGLNSYKRAMIPGKGMAPAGFSRPRGRLFALLKSRRLAPMTGPLDFNHDQMRAYAKGLELDGHQIRLFVYEDMGHEMPTPGRFLEAMRWVDAPRRRELSAARAQAQTLLREYRARWGELSPQTDAQRAQLVEVTRAAPWSGPAWEAAELLEAVDSR